VPKSITPIIVTPPLIKRFWEKIPCQPEKGCWLWRGLDNGEYGSIYAGPPNTVKQLHAHRVSYAIHHGDTDLYVFHTCDVKSCVRPDHLYACTPIQNTHDILARGGFDFSKRCKDGYRGERNAMARLTREQVRYARQKYRDGLANQEELALELGVSRPHMSGIILRKFWGWLPDEW
jgi:hypothetical protein